MKIRIGWVLLFSIFAASLLLLPSTANSNDDSPDITHGNGLLSSLSHCGKSNSSFGKDHPSDDDFNDCFKALGYIMGVVDALPFSRPDGVMCGQDFEIVYAYLKNHVNQRQRRSVDIIRDAILEAFPPSKGK